MLKKTLKTQKDYGLDHALWVTVINTNEEIKLNRLIQWLIKTVAKMGTEFYEITKDNIKYRDFLKFIRHRVYELCNEANAIS